MLDKTDEPQKVRDETLNLRAEVTPETDESVHQ